MLLDSYNRRINYLRISVTDKCNLRCQYCRPASGIPLKKHEDILSLEEIFEIAKYAVGLGIEKIRLTGGEPLVRKNIEYLVERIAKLPSLKDFGMTTNGTMLVDYAFKLKKCGLHRVNISIDSLDPDRYTQITRGGDLNQALLGIKAARLAGLTPIKLNVVLIPGQNEDEREAFLNFAKDNDLEVRFIRRMNLKTGERYGIESNTTVGQCELCDRLRLTCTGELKPCLFSEYSVNVRKAGLRDAFNIALKNKPECGAKNESEYMYEIGG
ncbi:MAG: radical SAM protein [Pseudomonadota bacterium]